MTSLNRARCLSFLIIRSSARWAFPAPMARNARKRQSMPCSREENEKSKMDWLAGGRPDAWRRVAGFIASFACNVRPREGRYGHGNSDAVGASQSACVSVHRCQKRKRRSCELLDRDVEYPEHDHSRH